MSFDVYKDSYREDLRRAIAFSGQSPEFFTEVKAAELLRIANRRLGDPARTSGLDVGCGVGLTDAFLAPRLGELHGVDVSSGVIQSAAARNPSVDYRTYDGTVLPFPEHAFDLVFAICVLHHVSAEARTGLLAEMARVTRAGGLVVVFEHNPYNPLTRLAVDRCAFDEDVELLSRNSLERLFAETGLEVVEARYILFFPWRGRRLRALERRLGALPAGAQHVVAGRRGA